MYISQSKFFLYFLPWNSVLGRVFKSFYDIPAEFGVAHDIECLLPAFKFLKRHDDNLGDAIMRDHDGRARVFSNIDNVIKIFTGLGGSDAFIHTLSVAYARAYGNSKNPDSVSIQKDRRESGWSRQLKLT